MYALHGVKNELSVTDTITMFYLMKLENVYQTDAYGYIPHTLSLNQSQICDS